jgi:hypothetical protein
LFGDRSGDGIQPLFQRAEAGIQPVAITVERIDGGRQSARLVLAFLGHSLDLLRLSPQIDGGDLIATQGYRGLIGVNRQKDGTDGRNTPRPEPPQPRTVENILFRQKSRQEAAGISDLEASRQLIGIPCHDEVFGPPAATRITLKTLTGNPPPSPIRRPPGKRVSNLSQNTL